MTDLNPVKPEDLIPDGHDTTTINGRVVRKGTVGAFLANINIIENIKATEKQKQDALDAIKELAPAIISIGLHQHVTCKNPQIEQILVNAAQFV